MNTFRAQIYRWILDPRFLFSAFFAMCVPFFTVSFIQAINELNIDSFQKFLEVFKSGGQYNFGLFSTPSLDSLKSLNAEDLFISVLSNELLWFVVILSTARMICLEYRAGYVYYSISKGKNRKTLYLQNVGISVIMSIPLIILCFAGGVGAFIFWGGYKIHETGNVLIVVLLQIMLLIGLVACVSGIIFLVPNHKTTLLITGGVALLPVIPGYLSVLTRNRITVGTELFPIALLRSNQLGIDDLIVGELFMVVTVVIVLAVGLYIISKKRIA